MTFAEILSAVYEDMNLASSPASTTVTRIKRYVNEGMRALLREPGLQRLVDSDAPYDFASVASTARYAVPEAVSRIHGIHERTNDVALEAMSLAAYRRVDPDAVSNTGTASHYVPIGRVAVATQPSNDSSLFVKSSSDLDTATVYYEVRLTDGTTRTGSVALNGLVAVNLSSSLTTIDDVVDLYLATATAGDVTLHEDSGAGTELARIATGKLRPRYYGFYLWPTPAAAVTYYVDYRREVTDLVNSVDEPPIPTDYHPLLVTYARMREYEKTDDSRYGQAREEFGLGLTRLKFSTQSLSDELPVIGGSRRGRSRLGGMYPADYYTRG